MRDDDLNWLAGLLEGEGSFLRGSPSRPNQPGIVVEMTDQSVIERVADLLNGVKPIAIKARNEKWKPTWVARVRGNPARNLMHTLRPLMSPRRQAQIDIALASPKSIVGDALVL